MTIQSLPSRVRKPGVGQPRRGITLLFVVSLIVLFLLMGTSFVLLAGQFRRSAVLTARVRNRIDDPRSLLFRAFKDLLREPPLDNINSPLRGHSILGDQYGYGAVSRIRAAEIVPNTGGQMIRINLDLDSTDDTPTAFVDTFRRLIDGSSVRFSDASGSLDGQVLSFVRGKLAGISLRILRYDVDIDTTQTPQVRNRWIYFVLPRSMTSVVFVDTAPSVTDVGRQPIGDLIIPEGNLPGQLPNLIPDVVINNRDFAGTGAGLFAGNPDLDLIYVDVDEPALVPPLGSAPNTTANTLLPNRKGETRAQLVPNYLASINPGQFPVPPFAEPNSLSTNEEYDALDFQNMFLGGWVTRFDPRLDPTFAAQEPKRQFVASFHRPALVRHNGLIQPNAPLDLTYFIDTSRRDVFLPTYAPQGPTARNQDNLDNLFQSDPAYAGPVSSDGIPDLGYDVDNDNDGQMDSVWIDIGLPIQTDSNGRRLKPLVAYMVLDMDGRLNINAHANLYQQEITANRGKATAQDFLHTGAPDFGPLPAGPVGLPVSFGQGYGPPEISLLPAFQRTPLPPLQPGDLTPAQHVSALLQGSVVSGTLIVGRYGNDLLPGVPGRDAASAYKLFLNPDRNYPSRGLLGNAFSSWMDIHGRLAMGVPDNYRTGLNPDPYDVTAPIATRAVAHALPTVDITSSSLANEIADSAYELDFARAPFASATTGIDTPFSPRELETLMRRNDWDAGMLPGRLRLLMRTRFNETDWGLESLLTTDSFEVPVPSSKISYRLRDALINIGNLAANPLAPTPAEEVVLQRQLELMLAPEVLQGRKMDLNFPLGNGLDDNSNGTVDEPAEQAVGEVRPDVYGRVAFGMDYDRTGTVGGSDYFARQIFARRLYVLTLLATQLVDRNGDGAIDLNPDVNGIYDWFDYNNSTGAPDMDDLRDYRRDIAQWVANVIEFRDPDSIHGGYEFDLDPWDGWGLDGNIATNTDTSGVGAYPAEATNDRFVVWGTERPELLLTESSILHDRRTEDTNNDPSGQLAASEPPDQDLDSLHVPNASAFIELYNPWYRGVAVATGVNNTDVFPGELYGTNGVELDRVSATGGDPVWRIVASRWNDDPGGGGNAVEQDIRFVYFVRPAAAALRPNARFPDPTLAIDELRPGQYAVIGSSGVQNGADYDTYLGRRNTPTWDTELGDTRRITLRPGSDEIELRWWDDAADIWRTTTRNNVVVTPIDRIEDGTANGEVRSLGLTDPASGYEAVAQGVNGNAELVAVADGFKVRDSTTLADLTLDEPLDRTANDVGGSSHDEWEFLDKFPGNPTTSLGLRDNALHGGVRRLKLQRLANPLLPWNPEVGDPAHSAGLEVNPYLTIDILGADVVAFNGLSADPEFDSTLGASLDSLLLQTFERSTNQNGPPNGPDPEANNLVLLWRQDRDGYTENPNRMIANAGTVPFLYPPFTGTTDEHYLSQNLVNSLGEPDLGYRQDETLIGNAPKVYPWLSWNNRPYVSHLELVNVPFSNNEDMLQRFGLHNVTTPDEFQSSNVNRIAGAFNHLPDFLADDYSRPGDLAAPPMSLLHGVPGLHRLFEFVEVPSRFVGTQLEMNPQAFSVSAPQLGGPWNSSHPEWARQYFYPPYTFLAGYREPGKINLNTIWDERVWTGLFGDYNNIARPLTEWEAGLQTPSGWYDVFDYSRLAPNVATTERDKWPTEYPGLFRSPEKSNYVPSLVTGLGLPPTDALVLGSAQVGLTRGVAPTDPMGTRNPANNLPLLDFRRTSPVHFNPDRNASFRYDQRQRLGNLTTQRSSVFAVWVTVGFFEVDEQDRPVEEPDVSRRQRGFWLIDRSIPVAFEPGKDHNVERVILTSSIIE